ncbi:hydroxyisourate hydrolase [Actinokineospora bangkokensis]|uniref:Transthyretin/hydroxyisourate hydrolase domain-containing protein n=1 Tax=Actinokineospora bangkokensis TaxID=1193682 RepID=A0A1Q9LMB8_9PSEU|nr:hydroxyisourate hydrolase [Actinokineospora bangkokensis]OLR93186.1 hypothetical protein BJP25_16955 [Actinokineospora bangkokensis]
MAVFVAVTDATFGRPAEGVLITLAHRTEARWTAQDTAKTDEAGRVRFDVGGPCRLRLTLDLDGYFAALGMSVFQSRTDISFRLATAAEPVCLAISVTPSSLVVVRTT